MLSSLGQTSQDRSSVILSGPGQNFLYSLWARTEFLLSSMGQIRNYVIRTGQSLHLPPSNKEHFMFKLNLSHSGQAASDIFNNI